jgi:hypothetical protein
MRALAVLAKRLDLSDPFLDSSKLSAAGQTKTIPCQVGENMD